MGIYVQYIDIQNLIKINLIRPNKKIGVVQVTRPTLDFYPLP